MTYPKLALATCAAFLFFGSSALAADLKNMDAVTYTIYFETEDIAKTVTIGPNGSISDICSNCYISIEETESDMAIEDEAVIVIKDGKLVIEEKKD